MPSRYFPIKTQTACPLKWSWSTLYLYDGLTASCHRTGWDKLTVDNFDQFHNTIKKQQERQSMLEGQWPSNSCAYCQKLEEHNGFSDRKLHLSIPDQYPNELDLNPTLTDVVPTILEVYFNNICNLSCLYCMPTLSSKINQENKKFGNFNQNGVVLEGIDTADTTPLVEKLWNWLDRYSMNLKRFHVLGGEPLYQSEFYQLLDYLDKKAHPNLELHIVSNLAVGTEKLQEVCDRFQALLSNKKLKRVDVTCSIDCWGEQQEYVRYGLDLKLWQKNFETLLGKKWIKLNINQTISVLTIKTMPELLNQLAIWRKIRPIGHFFSEVTPAPTYMMPHIFGNNVFREDFEKILNLIPESESKQYMSGIANRINQSTPDTAEIIKLHTFLNEKDRRRNTRWQETFPWLENIFEKVSLDA